MRVRWRGASVPLGSGHDLTLPRRALARAPRRRSPWRGGSSAPWRRPHRPCVPRFSQNNAGRRRSPNYRQRPTRLDHHRRRPAQASLYPSDHQRRAVGRDHRRQRHRSSASTTPAPTTSTSCSSAPEASRRPLMSDAGGSATTSPATNLTLRRRGADPLPDEAAITAGTYQPDQLRAAPTSSRRPPRRHRQHIALSVFDGTNAAGHLAALRASTTPATDAGDIIRRLGARHRASSPTPYPQHHRRVVWATGRLRRQRHAERAHLTPSPTTSTCSSVGPGGPAGHPR